MKTLALIILLSSAAFAHPARHRGCESVQGFVPDGAMITGYDETMSLPGIPCRQSTTFCQNGRLVGRDLYPSCSDFNQNCQGVPNGGIVSGYMSMTAPCTPSIVTCINGMLTGPTPVPFCN